MDDSLMMESSAMQDFATKLRDHEERVLKLERKVKTSEYDLDVKERKLHELKDDMRQLEHQLNDKDKTFSSLIRKQAFVETLLRQYMQKQALVETLLREYVSRISTYKERSELKLHDNEEAILTLKDEVTSLGTVLHECTSELFTLKSTLEKSERNVVLESEGTRPFERMGRGHQVERIHKSVSIAREESEDLLEDSTRRKYFGELAPSPSSHYRRFLNDLRVRSEKEVPV